MEEWVFLNLANLRVIWQLCMMVQEEVPHNPTLSLT